MTLKELDKFVRHFILKSIQIIVQSRLGSQRTVTQCNPNGNDWFNLAINDIKDINEQTKRCFELICSDSQPTLPPIEGSLKVKQNWRICCEISLKTNDGNSMVLEYWYFTNKMLENTCEDPTLSQQAALPVVIYNVYNRMSLMLKSLLSLTRATPAYKLSCRGQSADSYVICYRVYNHDWDGDLTIDENQVQCFVSPVNLGTIRSAYNELSVAVVYRAEMALGCRNVQNNCLTLQKSPQLLPVKKDHFKEEKNRKLEHRDKPLMAAFACGSPNSFMPLLPEAPFSSLLHEVDSPSFKNEVAANKSDPIAIPSTKPESPSSPVYSSSGDSFVFVELKAPFASEEHHELGSFFNGPSPTFTSSCTDSNGDLSDITVQLAEKLAEIETNAQQWDSFVDSICCDGEVDE